MSRRVSFVLAAVSLSVTALGAVGHAAAQNLPPVSSEPIVRPTVVNAAPRQPDRDVEWRFAAGLGGTKSSGNSKSASLNITAEAVRITDSSKLNIAGRALYAEANEKVTGANGAVGAQYDLDITRSTFGFGKIDYLRDRTANIDSRLSTYGGLGYHVFRTDNNSWDISGGFGYTEDRYVNAAQVAGALRTSYGRVEGVVSESSTHKVTETTSLRQKLGIFPNLKDGQQYRVVFDAGVSVAINSSISMTAGMTYRHDSDPGLNLRKGDSLYVTGISIKYD
jgi:putative salt-induced outer membrane protein YdiY